MQIREDDLQGPEIAHLLQEHLQNMADISPPQSIHALDLQGLRAPEITMWCAWQESQLLGCGALKQLDPQHGEIKSMRTAQAHQRKGIASKILQHIIQQAQHRNYTRLSLETGSMDPFKPAQALYKRFGFTYSQPFADYTLDPNSVFMTREL